MLENRHIKSILVDDNLKYYYKSGEKKGKIEDVLVNHFDYCFNDELLKFTFDKSIKIPEPITSGCGAIKLSIYMGFKKINLVGFDGNISTKSHFSNLYEKECNRYQKNFKGHIFNRYDEFRKEFLETLKIGRANNIQINLLTKSSYTL